MSKFSKDPVKQISEDESFEIIELAIDDIELLAKAFTVISEACADETSRAKREVRPEKLIH